MYFGGGGLLIVLGIILIILGLLTGGFGFYSGRRTV